MYQDEFSRYLTDNSRCLWHRVPRLYVDYKISTSPMGHICVATPDAYPRQEPFCRFYMPKENQHIYHPRLFVDRLVNTQKNLAKSLPWIKFDVDNFPKIHGVQDVYMLGNSGIIHYEIGLTGDVKMKNIASLSNQTLGISSSHNIAYNAKQTFWGVAQNMKADFNAEKMEVSVGQSLTGPLGSTSFKLSSDGSIEAEFTPNGGVSHIDYLDWLFELNLGFKIKARYIPNNDTSADASKLASAHTSGSSLLGLGIVALVLIVCSGGVATPEVVAASAVIA